jgi:hypothetical protein
LLVGNTVSLTGEQAAGYWVSPACPRANLPDID